MAESQPDAILPHPDTAWTTRDIATWLNVHVDTVRKHVVAGTWPHHKIDRRYVFTPADRAAIDELTKGPGQPPTRHLRTVQ